jgi:hypothetical protein
VLLGVRDIVVARRIHLQINLRMLRARRGAASCAQVAERHVVIIVGSRRPVDGGPGTTARVLEDVRVLVVAQRLDPPVLLCGLGR